MMLIQNFDGGGKTLGGEPSGVALKRRINGMVNNLNVKRGTRI